MDGVLLAGWGGWSEGGRDGGEIEQGNGLENGEGQKKRNCRGTADRNCLAGKTGGSCG